MSLSARLYQHTNYGGRSTSIYLRYHREFGGIPTYGSLNKSALEAYDMHDRTSSIKVSATTADNDYGRLILFQNARYKGRYASFQVLSGQTTEAPKLSDIDFNDRTSSALLVRRFKAECPPIPIDLLIPGDNSWKSFTEELVGMAISVGNYIWLGAIKGHGWLSASDKPTITWDMWPEFSPERTYVHLRLPLVLESKNWLDYDCEMRLWLYFYIDSGGSLRGHVEWYGAWVEGGLYTQEILDGLMEDLEWYVVDKANNMIFEAVKVWESLTFERLYYLPGRYSGPHGHVNEGVRLVLVTEV